MNRSNCEITKLASILKNIILENTDFLFLGDPLNRLPYHLSFLLKDRIGEPINSRRFVRLLSNKGICVSTGSACSLSSEKPSMVLNSMGISRPFINSALRISLGSWNTYDEIITAAEEIKLLSNYSWN